MGGDSLRAMQLGSQGEVTSQHRGWVLSLADRDQEDLV